MDQRLETLEYRYVVAAFSLKIQSKVMAMTTKIFQAYFFFGAFLLAAATFSMDNVVTELDDHLEVNSDLKCTDLQRRLAINYPPSL